MLEGMDAIGYSYDHAVAAFIEDLERLGLTDEILLITSGEMGRTPRINKNGGRDHWGNLCTLAFVGGGLKMGQVIGKSDRTGSQPASDPISSGQVLATVMNVLFDLGQLRLMTGVPKELEQIISSGKPIEPLFG
jgi:uncharacterized protein (DUF1501 family)